MQDHESEYCSFREVSALVVTWNAGASTPGHLRHEASGQAFFSDVVKQADRPDILCFGFQELVDLEDKRLTASASIPRFVLL